MSTPKLEPLRQAAHGREYHQRHDWCLPVPRTYLLEKHDSNPPVPDEAACVHIGGAIGVGNRSHPAGGAERYGDFKQHPRHTNDFVGSASPPGPTGDALTDTYDCLVIPTEVRANFQQSLA